MTRHNHVTVKTVTFPIGEVNVAFKSEVHKSQQDSHDIDMVSHVRVYIHHAKTHKHQQLK